MKLLDIYARMKKDIAFIEKELERSVDSDHDMLRETASHLLKAGGKRIRPVIVLLAAQFGTYDLERLKRVAVPLELIHMASLVHDDVVDDAELRRGQLTVKSKWDSRIAMYTGDYIFAKALMIATELDDPEIHRILSKAVLEMSVGEIEQLRMFYCLNQSVRDYLLRIRRKTALLIAISCQLGAIAAGAPRNVCNKLYSFGYNIGMAFQIRDDILDLTGTEKVLGKPPGSDIRQGNITLPVLYALRDENRREWLSLELRRIQETEDPAPVSRILESVRTSRGVEYAEQLANRYIDKAIDRIGDLPDIQAKEDLIRIAQFIGNRSY